MRSRKEIMYDTEEEIFNDDAKYRLNCCILEVLLDIRDNMGPRITMKPEDKNEE